MCYISYVFPKSRQAGYLMINRASVPMWGIAGKSAGPPKWAGKKSDCRPLSPAIVADLAPRIRFYLHKEFRAAGIRFLSTQRIGGGDLEENGDFH